MSIFNAPSFYTQADQDIYNRGNFFIPQEKFRGGAFSFPTTPTTTTGGDAAATGINTVINQGGGGGGGGVPFTGGIADLTNTFMDTITARQDKLNNPPDKFFGFDTMRNLPATEASTILAENIGIPQEQTFAGKIQDAVTPQSADQIIAEGYQEPRFQPSIIGAILNSFDRYPTLPRGDQAFIARNMGYTGPTVFGENTSGGAKDIFGLNVRSGFGNYAEAVENQVNRLDDYFGGEKFDKKYGADTRLELDEETGLYSFVGKNAARANQMNKMNLARYNFYKKQVEQRDADRAAAEAAERRAAIEKEKYRREIINRDGGGGQTTTGITTSRAGSEGTATGGYGGGADMGSAASSSGTSDQGFTSGGAFSGLRYGGRVGYMMGGLTNLVDIYD